MIIPTFGFLVLCNCLKCIDTYENPTLNNINIVNPTAMPLNKRTVFMDWVLFVRIIKVIISKIIENDNRAIEKVAASIKLIFTVILFLSLNIT